MGKEKRKIIRNIRIDQILSYRLPAAGVMSILHRVSGAGLFLMLPFLIYLFEMSLESATGYDQVRNLMQHPLVFLVLAGLGWAFTHHFLAGLRHLMCDLHLGLSKGNSANWGIGVISLAIVISLVLWSGMYRLIF